MKAILLNKTGDVENLKYQDTDQPTLKKGEVLVKVKAISINPLDVIARADDTLLTQFLGEERPVILGWDISGEISEKAEDVNQFDIGDAVFGMLEADKGGAYAEYVAVSASLLANKPKNISDEEASATTLAALTAWQPLVYEGKIKKGDKVLIHAASGGVGHFAVQIAKHFGAEVIATSSGKNRDFVRSLGADQHINYKTQKFYEEVDNVDFVLDMVGGDTLSHSVDIVKEGGKIITLIPTLSEEQKQKARESKVDLAFMESHASGKDMNSLADLLSKGAIKAHVSKTFPFSEMGKAHKEVESGHTVGKVVVTL